MTPDLAHIRAILNEISPNIRAAILDHHPGHPRAQAYDSDRTSSGQGPSDPTSATALAGYPEGHGRDPNTEPNQAKADLVAHDDAIVRAYTALLALAALQQKYAPPHEPRRGTILTETRGCELHRRAGIETHRPAHRSTDLASSLEPKLPQSLPLCMACIDHARTYGRIPTPEELRHHDRTGKWKQRTTGKRVA